jgi:hypothetical protein
MEVKTLHAKSTRALIGYAHALEREKHKTDTSQALTVLCELQALSHAPVSSKQSLTN